MTAKPEPMKCDWCGKSQHEVKRMLATLGKSPKGQTRETSICNECVELCMIVVASEDPECRKTFAAKLGELDEPDSN